jgi:hypothetical protein
LDAAQVYSTEHVGQVLALFLGGADRDKLDPILDACVTVYRERLDENGQVDFKGKAQVFRRAYAFLSSVIPYSNAEWEKLSIFLDLFTPKLPAPMEEDLATGILEAIDMDSYRVEKKAAMKIALADKDAEIEALPTDAHGHKPGREMDRLSNILKSFNEQFGTLFTDSDRVAQRIRDDIAPKVAADPAYKNAKENTPHTARMAHDQALGKVMQHLLKDDTQVYKQFVEGTERFENLAGRPRVSRDNDVAPARVGLSPRDPRGGFVQLRDAPLGPVQLQSITRSAKAVGQDDVGAGLDEAAMQIGDAVPVLGVPELRRVAGEESRREEIAAGRAPARSHGRFGSSLARRSDIGGQS